MGTLVDMRGPLARRQATEREKPVRTGQVLLFTGVRYERWSDVEDKPANGPAARKQASD
jgi:hypothetical protein